MVNQKQGVYNVTSAILEENNIELEGAILDLPNVSAIRKQVVEMVAIHLHEGAIEISADAKSKYSTIEKMRSYASGLVNNWFRKDTRLNGGMKYEVKNPGSRQGAGDQQLKALKTLRDMKAGDADAVYAIDQAIELRKMELAEAKVKKVTIDLDKIPADLRIKLGL